MSSTSWPARPLLYSVLGGLSALAIFFLTDTLRPTNPDFSVRLSGALAIAAFSLIFAIVAQRDRWFRSLVFSLLVAIVVGGIGYSSVVYDWPYLFNLFNLVALGVAVFVFIPFYQAALYSKWSDYKSLHDHAWWNTVVAPLGLLFVGLTFAVAYLLAELFSQVEIEFFKKLLRRDITGALLSGVALGASLGVLREHESIVASTQRLVQSIFALLTCPLAIGLSGFLLVLPFTGFDALWNSTRDTSATLFASAFAVLVFVNSAVRENAVSQSDNQFIQLAARLLAVCLAPLAIISALAIKLRVDQYGWTPDRIWAAVICALLVVYGLLYLLSAIRWHRFNESLRQMNLAMALVICIGALLLATPILDFGSYSTKDQLARVRDGRVSEDKLDLTSLGFDFGPSGRVALNKLKETSNEEFAKNIDHVLNAKTRWAANAVQEKSPVDIAKLVTVLTGSAELPEELLAAMSANNACNEGYCYLFWAENDREAFVVSQTCYRSANCQPRVHLYRKISSAKQWNRITVSDETVFSRDLLDESGKEISYQEFLNQLDAAAQQGKIEMKPVQRLQIIFDGEPYGPTTIQR